MKLLIQKILILSIILCVSCKDKDVVNIDRYQKLPKKGTVTEKYLDSLYMYANELWLWNSYLPKYQDTNIRKYATYNRPEAYTKALKGFLGKIRNPSDNIVFERSLASGELKYSRLAKAIEHNKRAEINEQGVGEGFGFDIGELSNGDIRVAYVNQGSSAFRAGISRGDKLLKINDRIVSGFDFAKSRLNDNLLKVTLQKSNKSEYTVEIMNERYTSNAIYKSKILDVNGDKIGYLAYARFSNAAESEYRLNNIIQEFANVKAKTLIVDLRYNTGGFVSSVRYLANLIAPSKLNEQMMYSEHYNKLMQRREATILKRQPYYDTKGNRVMVKGRPATFDDVDFSVANNSYRFKKTGNLEGIEKIYFIVSGNTASASEMLINIFKPYLDVRVVGTQTYGKPVGFFGLRFDKYTLYLSNFLIKNANNEADYFDGFFPDISAIDDLEYDFGDVNEDSLAKVILDINGVNARGVCKSGISLKEPIIIKKTIGMFKNEYKLKSK